MSFNAIKNVLWHLVKDPRLASVSAQKVWGHLTDRRHRSRTLEASEIAVPFHEAMGAIVGSDVDIAPLLEDPRLQAILHALELTPVPTAATEMGGAGFLEMYYVLVRALRPSIVVETGVALGYSSAVILQALKDNMSGQLISVDLPPLSQRADSHVGAAVPVELRDRWTLLIGPDRRELRRHLSDRADVDLAFYDSDKSYASMLRTWELLWASIRPNGALVCDDIQTNDAYLSFTDGHHLNPLVTPKPGGSGVYQWNGRFLVGLAKKPS